MSVFWNIVKHVSNLGKVAVSIRDLSDFVPDELDDDEQSGFNEEDPSTKLALDNLSESVGLMVADITSDLTSVILGAGNLRSKRDAKQLESDSGGPKLPSEESFIE
jgi:hypothetical protein